MGTYNRIFVSLTKIGNSGPGYHTGKLADMMQRNIPVLKTQVL